MKKSLLCLGMAAALSLGASAASASEFLFQWDDSVEGHLFGITYKDGVVIQNVDVGAEAYSGTYGLWDSATLASSFDVAFNIFDPDGVLSDTWHIFGTEGASRFDVPFYSDIEGQTLLPLPNAFSITENGQFQTVYDFTANNGDHYSLQFRSDVESVPEPGTWALMIGGFGLVGMMARRRKIPVLQSA